MKIDNIKGVILDYGGTIDSYGTHWSEIIYDGYLHAGVNIDKALFRESYVYAERALARQRHIYPQHNFLDLMRIKIAIELEDLKAKGALEGVDIAEVGEKIARYCYEQAAKAVADVKPTLEWLKERYPVVLVSNFYGNIEAVLLDFGIRGCFNGIIESSVVGVRKPDPVIFKLGVVALGCEPQTVVVVGDSYSKDIAPSMSLGCQAVWLKGKGWDDKDNQEHPEVPQITSLNQLPELLK